MNHYPHPPAIQQRYHNITTLYTLESKIANNITQEPSTLNLIQKLYQALAAERITYYHWKSNDAIENFPECYQEVDE